MVFFLFHSYILHIYNILQRVRELYMMLVARDVYVMNYEIHDMNKKQYIMLSRHHMHNVNKGANHVYRIMDSNSGLLSSNLKHAVSWKSSLPIHHNHWSFQHCSSFEKELVLDKAITQTAAEIAKHLCKCFGVPAAAFCQHGRVKFR